MKKGTKIALGIALVCIGLGLILTLIAFSMDGYSLSDININRMDTVNTVIKTEQISDDFHSININDVQCDIRILPSTDSRCKVVYTDSDLCTHHIRVENYTLYIEAEDVGDFSDHLFVIQGSAEVTVYLPMDTLVELNLETVSGSIAVTPDFSLRSANLSTTSGEIDFTAQVSESLDAATTSGSIEISGTSQCEVDASSTSGDISLVNMEPASLSAATTTGDIELEDVVVSGQLNLSTASGDVELIQVDAHSAQIGTASGDIEGSILSPKQFETDTVSGDIRVENTHNAKDYWEVSTTSGCIELVIVP